MKKNHNRLWIVTFVCLCLCLTSTISAMQMGGFDIDIGNLGLTAKGLCDWTKISSSEFGTIAETLNGAFVSVGLQLLTVFVMIDLIKKAMEIDRISWERIVMSVARFLIFKMLITYSYEFLNMIMKIGQQFMNILLRTVNYQTSAGTSIGATIGDMINNEIGRALYPCHNVYGFYRHLFTFDWYICDVYCTNIQQSRKNCLSICIRPNSPCNRNMGRR